MRKARTATPKARDQRGRVLRALPLTLPGEIWRGMPRAEKAACRRAQVIHDLFSGDRRLPLSSVLEQTGFSLAATLPAVEVLNRLELVAVMAGPEGLELRLVATPEDHVRITGPDGKDSWVFVARPLDPPSLAYSELN